VNAFDLMTRFQRFEKDADLFAQTVNGAPWWDCVRYDVHSFLGQVLLGRGVAAAPQTFSRRIAGQALASAKRWNLYLTLERDQILLIRAPRAQQAGRFVDIALDPIGDLLSGKTATIDTFPRRYHVPHLQASSRSGSVPPDLARTIAALLEAFSIPQSQAADLEKIIRFRRLVFETELRSYDRLFRRARPRMVALVQNGIEKALFATARAHGIPTAEVQHGLVGFSHSAYSYAPDIDYTNQPTFPDMFFSFSEFWNSACHYPAGACLAVGNDSYCVKTLPPAPAGAAMVVSASIYHETLSAWVRAISALSPHRRIIYKLHPGQIRRADQIIQQFSDLPNVEVMAAPVPASALLGDVSHVIVVCSTVAYEALQAGRGVCLVPEQDYHCHKDIIGLPGVAVPPTPEALDRALDTESPACKPPRFFDPFNPTAALAALEAALRTSAHPSPKTP